MSIDLIKERLEKLLDADNIKYDEPMKNHTSFRVGGPVDILVTPLKVQDVISIISLCKENNINYYIMGNGTNIIVRSGGFKGVIIKLTSLNQIEVDGVKIRAQAGALLSCLSKEALKHSLKGLEFASGIPGTVGGAVTMNAGAYGPEIKDVIESALVIDDEGIIKNLTKEQLDFSYRSSVIQKKNYIVLEAVFNLQNGDYDEIKAVMEDLNRRRSDKQPINYPSAGSTFKRPLGNFAGKLIEDAQLKGISIGGACVSEKHAGFIINNNNASAQDVITLIKMVRDVVKDKFDVELETEVKIIGED